MERVYVEDLRSDRRLGCLSPKRIVTNHELQASLDTSDEWIVQRTGIRERRIADANETTSTLAVQASWAACQGRHARVGTGLNHRGYLVA